MELLTAGKYDPKMTTIISPKQFSPVEDAENIKTACQGWGTDEKAIISILGHRNLFQRKLVRLAFQEIYHQDLLQQLKCELSGDFERAISLWTLDPADRDAVLANEALQKSVLDYRVIIEIACIRSPEELLAVKRAYKFRYKRSLEEDLASFTAGDLRKLLVGLISAYRYDGDEFDETLAHSEATVLNHEIHGTGFNQEEVIRIVSTRSQAQLNATFNIYRDIYSRSITKGFPGGDYFSTLRTVIRCIRDPQKYYAKVEHANLTNATAMQMFNAYSTMQVLRAAINTEGTDEDALSRVIVTRAEKDLKEINEVYLKRNNVSVDEAVARDCSGDYKAFIMALLGADDN
ncbi:ANNEXIN 8, annexin 8 [Hibiscus trionum]|uniref:Annexin n=1 Tax=Hibiscus trionum TaxID=183268 RepID=A0A9W7HTD9_HIBTR|nr:ANNEXIN 8, annexin 8 [Hibiscus trionum]